MLLSLALRAGHVQNALAQRRKAALGTRTWGLWLLAWLPARLVFVWLLDLSILVHGDA